MKVKNKRSIGDYIIVFVILAIAVATFVVLKPVFSLMGDSGSYVQSMNVLEGGDLPEGFVPNRLMTSFLALNLIIVIGKVVGGILAGWITLNTILFLVGSIVFYKLILNLFKDRVIAVLSGVLFAANYDLLSFGINYLLDIGGWVAFVLSLFFLHLYAEKSTTKYLYLSLASVAVGSLFKEYSILAMAAILPFVLYESHFSIPKFLKKIILPTILTFVPLIGVHLWVYYKFGYTYLDWFGTNQSIYGYTNWMINSVKSFGVVLNIALPLVIYGMYVFVREYKTLFQPRERAFILCSLLSVVPIFFWPSITERVIFPAVPVLLLFASIAMWKHERYKDWFVIPVVVYALLTFLMDPFILNLINLPF